MVRRKWMLLTGTLAGLLTFSGAALSATSIQLLVNGRVVTPEVPPQIIEGNTMVPIRAVAEALGAKVEWDGAQQKVTVDQPSESSLQRQLELLRGALAPATADAAAEAYAKAVQGRNGAAQFALLSAELQSRTVQAYEELNWVSGVSSPWVAGYKVSKAGAPATGNVYELSFQLATSTGSAGSEAVTLTVGQTPSGGWEITALQPVAGTVGSGGGTVVMPSADAAAPAGLTLSNPQQVQQLDERTAVASGEVDGKLALLRTTDGGLSWRSVPVATLQPAPPAGAKALFRTADDGWLAWYDGKATQLAHTTDGGASWNVQTLQGYNTPVDIVFADAKRGWLLSVGDAAMMKSEKRVFRTEDGGASWTLVSNNAPNAQGGGASATANALPLLGQASGFEFRSATEGFVSIDNPVSDELLFYRTSDGGATWREAPLTVPASVGQPVAFSDFSTPVFSGENLLDGVMTARLAGAADEKLVVYATQDGGATWTVAAADRNVGARYRVAFADATHGWLLDDAALYRTSDGGQSWQTVATNEAFRQAVGTDPAIRAFSFTDAQHGGILAGGADGDTAQWLETADGGATWRVVKLAAE